MNARDSVLKKLDVARRQIARVRNPVEFDEMQRRIDALLDELLRIDAAVPA